VVTAISDQELVELIRQVLEDSPFAGEGYRKVRARLGREHGVQVSGKRVLRLLRREGCWLPSGSGAAASHGRMTARSSPTGRTCWGTDATMAWTRTDGWVWVFACVDHYTAEAWAHVAKIGDRFAALQPVYDAVIDRWDP
jgi:putative transposase